MHIVFLTQQYARTRTGVGTYARIIVEGLLERGHRVTLAGPSSELPSPHPGLRALAASTARFDPTKNHWLSLSRSYSAILGSLLRDSSPDVVHFADAREALMAPPFRPIIGTIHDCYSAMSSLNPFRYINKYYDWPIRIVYYNIEKQLERIAIRKLNLGICNTRFVADNISRFYGVDRKRLEVVPIGLPERDFESPRRTVNKQVIVFAGANFQRKGLPALLRAVSAIRQDFPELELRVIGEDRMGRRLERLARRLGLRNMVKFLGWLPHERVQEHLSVARVYAMPSLVEAYGLTYIEAMQTGVPVIATSVGGPAEFIRDGENGFLVEPNDPSTLADRLRLLLSDPAFAQKMGGEGRKTAAGIRAADTVTRTIELYEDSVRHE